MKITELKTDEQIKNAYKSNVFIYFHEEGDDMHEFLNKDAFSLETVIDATTHGFKFEILDEYLGQIFDVTDYENIERE